MHQIELHENRLTVSGSHEETKHSAPPPAAEGSTAKVVSKEPQPQQDTRVWRSERRGYQFSR